MKQESTDSWLEFRLFLPLKFLSIAPKRPQGGSKMETKNQKQVEKRKRLSGKINQKSKPRKQTITWSKVQKILRDGWMKKKGK
jgi:hypothetical protein